MQRSWRWAVALSITSCVSVSLMDMVITLRLWEHGQSGPSPGQAPDRCDRRGEGCPLVVLGLADVHIHALFRRECQSFLRGGALILKAR